MLGAPNGPDSIAQDMITYCGMRDLASEDRFTTHGDT